MKATPIFTDTIRDLRAGTRRLIHQGGQWSGKTVGILEVLATLAAEDEPGTTTVTSMSIPHLKGGALRDFETLVYPEFKSAIKKYHRTDHVFSFRSGHIIEFKVFDKEDKALGGKRKRLFVNEMNRFDWMTFWQLDSRSDQTIGDFNPTIRFYAHEKYLDDPFTKWYYSNHWDNPFLTEQKHREIENHAVFALDEQTGKVLLDKRGKPIVVKGNFELWKVYARGLTGNVTGLIFPDWVMIEDSEFPDSKDIEWIFSVDFGYTNDPTAIVKIGKVGPILYIKELAYETGLQPKQIKMILDANGYDKRSPLYCEHDPDMVRLLRNLGLQAFLARKGQGSINAGIELINTFDVRYPSSSQNLHRERMMYIWDTDDMGDSTNKPVDDNNHLMDACRYGAFTKYLRNTLV